MCMFLLLDKRIAMCVLFLFISPHSYLYFILQGLLSFLFFFIQRKDIKFSVLITTNCLTDETNVRRYPTIAGPDMVMDSPFRR